VELVDKESHSSVLLFCIIVKHFTYGKFFFLSNKKGERKMVKKLRPLSSLFTPRILSKSVVTQFSEATTISAYFLVFKNQGIMSSKGGGSN
jgi:hypothetical protein